MRHRRFWTVPHSGSNTCGWGTGKVCVMGARYGTCRTAFTPAARLYLIAGSPWTP